MTGEPWGDGGHISEASVGGVMQTAHMGAGEGRKWDVGM